jgi:ABC-type phosphate/phosphonate transport system substrate-binding protein
MTGGLAALPMYDWPELMAATDRLWAALRDAMRATGIPAPDALTRDRDLYAIWLDPTLTLSMTCGLPVVRELAGRIEVIGAPDYGVPGAPPGWYRSALVVRADDPRDGLEAFRGARLALNGRASQSGYGAMLHHVAPHAGGGRFFGAAEVTGAHAVSIARVAEGAADIAAIDFVSWRIATAFRPEAARLRVLMLTDPTPGLPFIAARGADVPRYRAAIAATLDGLDAATRDALGLCGFVPLDAADYGVIRDRAEAAEAVAAI